jgi:PPM family protein phosphatase
VQTFSFSDKGPRPINQDCHELKVTGGRVFAAIADGVGGNNGGETASSYVIGEMLRCFEAGRPLNEGLQSAHEGLLALASANPELSGMATTLTAVASFDTKIAGVHSGDSRAYILRGNGLRQLTEDHTEVAKLLAEGKLSKQDAVNYPRKNVLTSAVGTHKQFLLQSFEFALEPNDRLVLLTDGVYSVVSKQMICAFSKANANVDDFGYAILNSIDEIGTTDNFTVVIVQFDERSLRL